MEPTKLSSQSASGCDELQNHIAHTLRPQAALPILTRHEVLLQQGPSLQCAPLEREHFLQHSP